MNFRILFLIFLLASVCLVYSEAQRRPGNNGNGNNGNGSNGNGGTGTGTDTGNGNGITNNTPARKVIARKIKIKNIKYANAKRKIKSPLVKSLKKLTNQRRRRKVIRRSGVVRPNVYVLG